MRKLTLFFFYLTPFYCQREESEDFSSQPDIFINIAGPQASRDQKTFKHGKKRHKKHSKALLLLVLLCFVVFLVKNRK